MSLNIAKIMEEGKEWELKLKTEIFEFIKSTFTKDIYNDHLQLEGYEDEFKGDYTNFLDNNYNCLMNFNSDEINLYYYLYKKIKDNKVSTLNTESGGYYTNKAFTFYFNIKGEFIIY